MHVCVCEVLCVCVAMGKTHNICLACAIIIIYQELIYTMFSKFQDIEKQFPSRDFERLPTPFQFVNEPSVDPNVTIQVSSTENCFATVETTSEVLYTVHVLVFVE